MPISRLAMRTAQFLVDIGVLACAYGGAFLVRFEGAIPRHMFQTLFVSLPLVLTVQLAVLRARGVHRLAWRYVSLDDARRILAAVATATLALFCIRAVIGSPWFEVHVLRAGYSKVGWFSSPIGVLLADSIFACTGLVGMRAVWRIVTERQERGRPTHSNATPTLLVGAGRAGALVAREIQKRPELGLEAVGFVDDDPAKRGTSIAGLMVLGGTEGLASVARKLGARQVLISMANVPGKAIRRVMRLCEEAELPVKIVPGLYELIGGTKSLGIRDVSLEDLLRREPVDLDIDAIADVVRGRVVLVTGAGGSIGSELCRQIARFAPKRLVLVEQAENNLFFIDRELRERTPELDLVPLVADICDRVRIDRIFATETPEVVFHAAAHKHVPMMEANPGEAIKNNVFGTMTVADAADQVGVKEFVLISTDKAVNPISIMGATKRAAEIYVQALSARSRTRFVAVRFGNVLGSTGSVVPIFREQIARGGPVTITHPDMKRYFMTIPEAVQLVLQAAAVGNSGEILILDMGDPVRMVDMAEDLITLSGMRPGVDIDIVFTGIRPGEKLFEELSTAEEAAERTKHARVFVGRITPHGWTEVAARFARLRSVVDRAASPDDLRLALREAVPDYGWRPEAERAPRPSTAGVAAHLAFAAPK